MQRTPVSSSSIASIGYDVGTQTLEVGFVSGAVYQYQGVPHDVYTQFMQAPSKGRYLNYSVKNRFSFSRVG